MAARMESHGEPGKIHVSEEFKHAVETQKYCGSLQFIDRARRDIKGIDGKRIFWRNTMTPRYSLSFDTADTLLC